MLEEIETEIAERQIDKDENEDLIQSNCQKNIFSTFAYDNNDSLKETFQESVLRTAQMGTIVQRSVDTC